MRRRYLATLTATAGLVAGLAVIAEPASAATPDCGTYESVRTGNISAGQTQAPWQYFFTITNPGPVELCLDGPDGADIDLVLHRLVPGGSVPVASAPSGGSDKTVTYVGPVSAYRAFITANSGGGAYTIGVSMP